MRVGHVLLLAVLLTGSGCVPILDDLVFWRGGSRRDDARNQLLQLETATKLFYLDIGRYPTDDEGLGILIERPADDSLAKKWNGPYLGAKDIPLDPWGNPYVYRLHDADEGVTFEIISYGADGKEGGTGADADISSRSPQ